MNRPRTQTSLLCTQSQVSLISRRHRETNSPTSLSSDTDPVFEKHYVRSTSYNARIPPPSSNSPSSSPIHQTQSGGLFFQGSTLTHYGLPRPRVCQQLSFRPWINSKLDHHPNPRPSSTPPLHLRSEILTKSHCPTYPTSSSPTPSPSTASKPLLYSTQEHKMISSTNALPISISSTHVRPPTSLSVWPMD